MCDSASITPRIRRGRQLSSDPMGLSPTTGRRTLLLAGDECGWASASLRVPHPVSLCSLPVRSPLAAVTGLINEDGKGHGEAGS